jgi:hypothetical protein
MTAGRAGGIVVWPDQSSKGLRFPMSLSALIQRINDLRPLPPAPFQPANPPNQRDLVIASLLRCPDVPAEDGAA